MSAHQASSAYERLRSHLVEHRYRWCVSGVAGFIGSNLLETLLRLDQEVVGIDNFATGFRVNLDQVRAALSAQAWQRFSFVEGDIRQPADCVRACNGVDFVLHQAAIGSVPRSIADPRTTHEANVDGFVNMLIAARDAKVKRFVYASSSSIYGDHPGLPKVEERVGQPLSPYAATKCINEMYASVFARSYGIQTVGLRYFNVFGPRQDPHGAYAAVIPRWIAALIEGKPVEIFGDGETSRDFCYVDNAVQINLLAATSSNPAAMNEAYNVAVGDRTSLLELFELLRSLLGERYPHVARQAPLYRDFRAGDVRHSQADIAKAQRLLGYAPTHRIRQGMENALTWYVADLGREAVAAHA
ncbi:MAG: NAD-dependent epimerase/dehydratase family protein [Burkholderiales bacterium]|nr:NAD-dependent epimerase/dehydratase family protein [Burkholderiales bacterium]